MYKHLLRFSILILIFAILFALYVLIHLSNQNNTIYVEPSEYVQVLEQVHSNPDKYIGKKFVISGYVYVQDDFLDNRFVIAQNVYITELSATEPFVIGFLCENHTNIDIHENENIKIEGVLDICNYNNDEYPILLIKEIT